VICKKVVAKKKGKVNVRQRHLEIKKSNQGKKYIEIIVNPLQTQYVKADQNATAI